MQRRNFLTTPRGIFLTAMVCCFLWGSAFPSIKIGYELFRLDTGHIPTQLLYAGVRFALAGVEVILFGSLMQKRPLSPGRGGWKAVLVMGGVQTVLQYLFYYVGLVQTTGVKASVICGSSGFFSILIACFLFRMEKFTVGKALGCVVGFAGVVLINMTGGGLGGGFAWNGEGFIILSTVTYALSSVLMRIFGQRADPVAVSGWQFLLGGTVLGMIGFALGGRLTFWNVSCWAIMLYLAFISAGAFSLWSLLLKFNPVSKVTIYTMLTPIFGVLLSTLFLREGNQVSPWQSLSALALVVFGIWIINRPEKIKE